MIACTLGISDARELYFTAEWLPQCKTLLQHNNTLLSTDENPYYRASDIVNSYLLNTLIDPVTNVVDQ
jgi:hypothetical protein